MSTTTQIALALLASRKTIGLAESCSGGHLSNQLTNLPGSSRYFRGTIVAYHNDLKTSLLKVPARLIARYGAVSKPVALKMAEGARKALKSDYGISITGIAGPSGGTTHKPVGLTFVCVASSQKSFCERFIFTGGRKKIKKQAANQALVLLQRILL